MARLLPLTLPLATRRRWREPSDPLALGVALMAAMVIGAPVLAAMLAGLLQGGGLAWQHLFETQLAGYTVTTLAVLALTGVFILACAVPAAWLVTWYRFPGRGLFEWLLILPLAAPGYVLAFAYADLFGVGGPVQSALREATGWSARDYWFPDIASTPGLAFVLAGALLPYVYLTARAAFVTTSLCTLDAARTLGASRARAFRHVALPAARPAIAAGLALALMEAAADYGAASFLGVETLTVGVFRAWESFGAASSAARIALILLLIALVLQVLERRLRGRAGFGATSSRWQRIERRPLGPLAAVGAILACAGLAAWGFFLPMGRLVWLAGETGGGQAPVLQATWNSVRLAAAGAGAGFVLGLVIALFARDSALGARAARWASTAGYAAPGAVLALGGLAVLDLMPFTLTGGAALVALVWIYASRFTAAGAQPMEAALARAPASLGHAAQSLGAGRMRRLVTVDLPIALPGALVGALILFVETLKELPATLMLRPFNWDTLAVRAYAYASDERLAQAALPCVMITLAGLAPVMVLSWRLSRARPGDDG